MTQTNPMCHSQFHTKDLDQKSTCASQHKPGSTVTRKQQAEDWATGPHLSLSFIIPKKHAGPRRAIPKASLHTPSRDIFPNGLGYYSVCVVILPLPQPHPVPAQPPSPPLARWSPNPSDRMLSGRLKASRISHPTSSHASFPRKFPKVSDPVCSFHMV